MVIQGPARGTHIKAFLRGTDFRNIQQISRLLEMLITQAMVLHGMRALCSYQMQNGLDAQTAALRFILRIRAGVHGKRVLSRFTRPHKAARHQMRQGIDQRTLHPTLFLLQAPAPRLPRNAGKSFQGAQRKVDHHKQR